MSHPETWPARDIMAARRTRREVTPGSVPRMRSPSLANPSGSQPDLNYRNPAVTAKMDDVVRFWLQDQGVDGFRLDAANYLIEEGQVQQNSDATHTWLAAFRKFYKQVKPQALTVGEIRGVARMTKLSRPLKTSKKPV